MNNKQPINKVKQYAGYAEYFFYFLAIFTIATMLLSIASFFGFISGAALAPMTLGHRIFITAATLIAGLLGIYLYNTCIAITHLFKNDQIFTQQSSNLFTRLRLTVCILFIYESLAAIGWYFIGISYVPTLFTKEQVILTSTSIGATSLIYITALCFLSILKSILTKAIKIKGDQDLTI